MSFNIEGKQDREQIDNLGHWEPRKNIELKVSRFEFLTGPLCGRCFYLRRREQCGSSSHLRIGVIPPLRCKLLLAPFPTALPKKLEERVHFAMQSEVQPRQQGRC